LLLPLLTLNIAGVDIVIDAEEDNDEHDIAIAELDNDNLNAVNCNQNERQIDPNLKPELILHPELNLNPEKLYKEQQIDDEPDFNIDQITDEQCDLRSDACNSRPRKPLRIANGLDQINDGTQPTDAMTFKM
jgi:hypothetical protein